MAAADQGQPPSSGAATSLAGFALAVASERRRHHLAGRLELLGARVASVQAVQTMAQPDADAVRAATLAFLAEPVNDVVVASVFGLRSWLGIARRLGHLDDVIGRLRGARLLARDARVADELRDLGLTEIWSTASLTTEDLFHYLLAQPQAGRRVLAQLDTDSERELCHALRTAGATVIEIATTIARPPRTVDVLRRLSDLIIRRQIDAVALTSGAATVNLLQQAAADGVLSELLNALVADVVPACLGGLAAQPLSAQGVTPLVATAPLLHELVVAIAGSLPGRALRISVAGYQIEIRGQAVVVDGAVLPVQPGPIAVLRVLASRPGRVLSTAEIRGLVPSWAAVDDHAIEMAISRLRRTLAGSGLDGVDLVQTVVRRGYRLAV